MRRSLGTASTRASRPRTLPALACALLAALSLAAALPSAAWAAEAAFEGKGAASEQGTLAEKPEGSEQDELAASVSMYRLYNPYTGEHLYTSSTVERQACVDAGWRYEGVGWQAPEKGKPVYRLYNPHVTGGDHHYTMSGYERDQLVKAGWRDEGVAWYSGGDVPLYRQYNPNAKTGTHNYTASKQENDELVDAGWQAEGIGWYAVAEGSSTPIMGESLLTAEQMADYYTYYTEQVLAPSGKKVTYPEVYAEKGAPTIEDFCKILVEEAEAEGVRADVVFMQAMKETGWLGYGGAVQAEWCNFAGLGAVNSNPVDGANRFPDVRTGLRAQVQHLKAYASTEPLVNECVDLRFDLVKRGVAPTLEGLDGRWAVPGNGYGASISRMIDDAVLYSQSK